MKDIGLYILIGLAPAGLLAFLIWYHIATLKAWNLRQSLKESGVQVEAEVIGKPSTKSHRTSTFYLKYEYLVRAEAEGGIQDQKFQGEAEVDEEKYRQSRIGGRVAVWYDKVEPSKSQLLDNFDVSKRLFMLILVDLAILITALVIWLRYR